MFKLRVKIFFLFLGFLLFLSLRPWIAVQSYNRAQTYYTVENFKKAIKHYKRAIFLMPTFILCYNKLGLLYEDMGKYEQAISIYKKSLKYDPQNSIAYFRIGFYYVYKKKDYLKALQWFYMAAEFNKEDPLIYQWLGICYEYLGLKKIAKKYYYKAEHIKKK